jgi:hypothetical protein
MNVYFKSFAVHVKWILCHHGMENPQVADGGDNLHMWKVTQKILVMDSQ